MTGLAWDSDTGEWGSDRDVQADVFVFAIHTCDEPELYDVLDVSQWEFYVVPADTVASLRSRLIGLTTLRRIAKAMVELSGVADAVENAA